jgi:YHS domain-containing protein
MKLDLIKLTNFGATLGRSQGRSGAKSQTFTALTMKCGITIFALWSLTFHASSAEVLPSVAIDKSHLSPGVLVWLEAGAHKLNVDKNGLMLKGYDPVAYFTQKKAVKGTANYQTKYRGATYYFSSPEDLSIFRKNPTKYVPQYGGFCANGMKNRKPDDIDPTVFFIINGKLYLCASPAAEKEFRSNEKENIKKADQNWDEEYRWWY